MLQAYNRIRFRAKWQKNNAAQLTDGENCCVFLRKQKAQQFAESPVQLLVINSSRFLYCAKFAKYKQCRR